MMCQKRKKVAQKLSDETGAGVFVCYKVLTNAMDDYDVAKELITGIPKEQVLVNVSGEPATLGFRGIYVSFEDDEPEEENFST